MAVGTEVVRLSHGEATDLGAAIGDAASRRREFVRTAGEHRPDGSYAVERRAGESPGNAKVFADFAALEGLYERLPRTFGAADLDEANVSGSRRHLVVRHVAEHPAFDCEIESRNPLWVRKRDHQEGDQVATPSG